jgi:hypothetical protein
MDYSHIPSCSIDYCPHPTILKTTLILENDELNRVDNIQFERFFRVWILDYKKYAPHLKSVKIVLRPTFVDEQLLTQGIERFLEYYITHIQEYVKFSNPKFTIDVDCYASQRESPLHKYMKNIIELPTHTTNFP